MLENDFTFSCPYCDQTLSVRLDVTGGQKQSFVYDCEICCRPVLLRFELEGEEVVNFTAEPENK